MHDHHDEQPNLPPFHEVRQSVNALVGAAQIMGRLVEVFLRWPGTWGERFCGFQMVISWMLAFFWSALFPTEDCRPMLCLWLAATGGLLVHRVCGLFRRNEEHSLYSGRPIFSWGRSDESRIKAVREPLLVLLAGLATLPFSVPLGWYLVAAGIALGLSASWQRAADRARLRAIRDARYEQEWFMQQQYET